MSERGCGRRVQDALYMCVKTSAFGVPIESFLVDPAIEWNGGQLRSPMLIEDSKKIVHIALGIGATYYPFVPDFVEEARRHGVSKRVPSDFKVERLTPRKSKLLLIHPRAIPQFKYVNECSCPQKNNAEHECVGNLWNLSALQHYAKTHERRVIQLDVEKQIVKVLIFTPSCSYTVAKPTEPIEFLDEYSSGIILAHGKFHFEYVNRRGEVPSKLKRRIQQANFTLEVQPE